MTSDAFERHVREYDAAMRRHDDRAAAVAMRELVKAGESFVAFLRQAAWIDMRHQDYAAAEAKFRTLSALTPGMPDIARGLASALIEQGDTRRALGMLRDLEADIRHYEDLVWLTEVYARLRRLDLARLVIRTEATRGRFTPADLAALDADIVLIERGPTEARLVVTARLDEFGGEASPHLLRRLARLTEAEFDYLGAVEAWSALARGKGTDADAHSAVTLLLFLQEFDRALALIAEVLKRQPRFQGTLQPLKDMAERGRGRLADVTASLGPTSGADVMALRRCLFSPATPDEMIWGRRALIEFLASPRAEEVDFLQFSQTLPNWEDFRIRRHALHLGLQAFPDSVALRKRHLRFQFNGNTLWRSGTAVLAALDAAAYDEEAIYQAIFCIRRLEQDPDAVTPGDAAVAAQLRSRIAAALPAASPRFRAFAQRSLAAIGVACPPWSEAGLTAEDRDALNRFAPFGFAAWEAPRAVPVIAREAMPEPRPVLVVSGQLRGFAQAWPSLHRCLAEPLSMPVLVSVWDRTSNPRGRHADRLGRLLPRDVMMRLSPEEQYDDVFEKFYPATTKLIFAEVEVTAEQVQDILRPCDVEIICAETASDAGYDAMVRHRPELVAGVSRMFARKWRAEATLRAYEASSGQTFTHVVWARPDVEILRLTPDTVQYCLSRTDTAFTNALTDRFVGDYLGVFPRGAFTALANIFPAAMMAGLGLFPWRPSRRDGAGREPTDVALTGTGSMSDALFACGFGTAEIHGLRCRLLGHTPPPDLVRASFEAEDAVRRQS